MKKHVFVIGPDEYNANILDLVRRPERYAFHTLLTYDEVVHGGTYDFDALVETAEERLRAFSDSIDAIVTMWDFPSSAIMALLRHNHELPRPSLESVVKCEHKYWSRVEQASVIPEYTPDFAAVNPFSDESVANIQLSYPFWLKPVKSLGSHLAFKIDSESDLQRCIPIIRERISRLGEPFCQFLRHVTLPDDIADVDGHWCVAEEAIAGRQCTIEGYLYDEHVEIYGVFDSIRQERGSSFAAFEYPSTLPAAVQERMRDAATRLMEHIHCRRIPFNIEFFYDEARDDLKLLEINPRISQSHSELFYKVDGAPNHEIMVELALGKQPDFPKGQGTFEIAGKFFIRWYADGVVTRVPTAEDMHRVQDRFPETTIELNVEEGVRLSTLPYQDSYSYILGVVFVGADNQDELREKARACIESLPFAVDDAEGAGKP